MKNFDISSKLNGTVVTHWVKIEKSSSREFLAEITNPVNREVEEVVLSTGSMTTACMLVAGRFVNITKIREVK